MLTIEEVAAETGRHPATVWRWLDSGELTGYQIGRRTWVVYRSDLETFRAKERKPGRPPKRRPGPEG